MDTPSNVVRLATHHTQVYATTRALFADQGLLLNRIDRFVDELHEAQAGGFGVIVHRGHVRYTVTIQREELPDDRQSEIPTP
jgi:hypothetical protein